MNPASDSVRMAMRTAERRESPTASQGVHPDLDIGRTFARSLASKDFAAVESVLHPGLTFRGLTPGRARYLWESHDPHSVVTDILQQWFEETDRIESLDRLEVDRVGYRFSGTNADGKFVIEQQAYYSVTDGRISWMSVVCSGFRPL